MNTFCGCFCCLDCVRFLLRIQTQSLLLPTFNHQRSYQSAFWHCSDMDTWQFFTNLVEQKHFWEVFRFSFIVENQNSSMLFKVCFSLWQSSKAKNLTKWTFLLWEIYTSQFCTKEITLRSFFLKKYMFSDKQDWKYSLHDSEM